jgi:hypothetical protein
MLKVAPGDENENDEEQSVWTTKMFCNQWKCQESEKIGIRSDWSVWLMAKHLNMSKEMVS